MISPTTMRPARPLWRIRRQRPRRAGMTLIELTVGIVVTGLIVSAGYAAFTTIIDQRERAARVAQETAHAVGLHRTLLQWLDNATLDQTRTAAAFLDPAMIDAVTFRTSAQTSLGTPSSGITLYTSSGRAGYGRGLFALMPPQGLLSTSINPPDSLRVLLDSTIQQMSVEYLIASNGTRQWQSQDSYTTVSNNGRILAIRLRLTSDDPTAATTFSQPIVAPLMGLP